MNICYTATLVELPGASPSSSILEKIRKAIITHFVPSFLFITTPVDSDKMRREILLAGFLKIKPGLILIPIGIDFFKFADDGDRVVGYDYSKLRVDQDNRTVVGIQIYTESFYDEILRSIKRDENLEPYSYTQESLVWDILDYVKYVKDKKEIYELN